MADLERARQEGEAVEQEGLFHRLTALELDVGRPAVKDSLIVCASVKHIKKGQEVNRHTN